VFPSRPLQHALGFGSFVVFVRLYSVEGMVGNGGKRGFEEFTRRGKKGVRCAEEIKKTADGAADRGEWTPVCRACGGMGRELMLRKSKKRYRPRDRKK